MKTKRLMSIVLALAMLCTMFGNLTAFALPGINITRCTLKVVDENGSVPDGLKIVYNETEYAADGTNVFEETADKISASVELTFTGIPNGYKDPGKISLSYTYTEDRYTNVKLESTTTDDSGKTVYNYVLTLEKENGEEDDDEEKTKYTITPDFLYTEVATYAVDKTEAAEGEEVKVTVSNIKVGWNAWTMVVRATDTEDILDPVVPGEPEEDGSYVYTFTMPAYNVKVDVNMNEILYYVDVRAGKDTDEEITDGLKYTLNVDDKNYTEADVGYSDIELSYADAHNKEATLTITAVPAGYKMPTVVTKTFKFGESFTEDDIFKRVNNSNDFYYVIHVILEEDDSDDNDTDETTSPFAVKAVVNSATTDVDADKEGTQVNAKDTVKVDVVVSGGDFTNADWEMIYDPTLFEYKSMTTNVDTTKGTVTTDDTKTAVLSGSLIANAGLSTGDEFADGTAIVTYEFTAKAQNADKVGTFKIESAHANNYVIAGTSDNKVANTENTTVEIVLVDNTEDKDEENGTVTVPAGTFTSAEKVYNAQKQTGNAFVLDEDFANAKVTYFANEDGSAVADTADLATKSFKTTLPSWKDVGTYTYYAKIYGDGLKTTYVSTTLTIKPATLVPSAMFTVDPSTGTNDVEFVPTLEGALDGTHNGTVTVKYKDVNGEEEKTLEASDFVYDGETTSVYNGTIKTTAATSGEFTVTLTYNDGTNDNYTGSENTAKVNVDKITADKVTVDALEETITSVFGYDSKAHSVEINADAVTTVTNGDWKCTISDTEASVTNVGDDKMVKVTFTDKNGVYNDVIVYVILKVTPANVKITVDDRTKVMNDVDPELTGTVKVVDGEGNEVTGVTFNANGLYGTDNLEVSYEREAGEAVGTYDITASYAPNDNYTVEVVNGTFTITAPSIDPENPEDAIVKVEVVDLSEGGTKGDETPDYTANKRLILVYTDVDKLFYGYKVDEDTTEKMFDVTAAGYKYVDNNYTDGIYTEDEHEYKHVYGIVVDAIDTYEATETYEKKYRDNVVFLSSDLKDAPENIVYDGDINLSNEIDVNDYSMTNGIYNNQYARATYIKNILKADINGDKKVDTTDVANVKTIFESKNK